MIWWTYLIRQTLCTIGSLERLFLQNLQKLYLEEWIRNSYNMKGTWQARSLSAGQWANGNRLDFRLTGWQIDSWPARSLSCCYNISLIASKSEFDTDLVKFSHIVSLLSLQHFPSILKVRIWLIFGQIFYMDLVKFSSNVSLLSWKSKSNTYLVNFPCNISLLAWKSEFDTDSVKFSRNISL